MIAAVNVRSDQNAATALRWAASFALVLGLHVGVILVVLRHYAVPAEPSAAAAGSDVTMLDLAPDPATPSGIPAPLPEPPQPEPPPPADVVPPQPEVTVPSPPEPQPQPITPPAVPAADVALPEPPPPPPVRNLPRRQVPQPAAARHTAKLEQAPAPSPREAGPPLTALVPASAPASANAVASWRTALIRLLQRAKRYPDAARERNEQGVAAVRLTMDRSGHVLSVVLVRSSDSQVLDEEAVAMMRRAEPLPPLPAGVGSDTLTLTIPVAFSLQ